MLMRHTACPRGFTLLEVLITMIVLAFGLLGLVNLQMKLHTAESESYQRAQAIVLLEDYVSRVQAAGDRAASLLVAQGNALLPTYVTGTGNGSALGYGFSEPSTCPTAAGVDRDKCEWTKVLKGGGETAGTDKVGAMIQARGCVQQITALDMTDGTCQAGVYRITVVWQGLAPTAAPTATLNCGQNLYGNEALRRAVSTVISIGTPRCVPAS